MSGVTVRYVTLRVPDWTFDPDELRAAFTPRTRAIVLNSPNNPTGRVFTLKELTFISELCQEFDALAITDEIYEHVVFDGARHVPILTLPGMRRRAVLVNSLSKTFSVTGWRVGWVVAPPDLTSSIRKVHDFLTVGAASPLQQAGVLALGLPDSYYSTLATTYELKRNLMLEALEPIGFVCSNPQGAYYVMAGIRTSTMTMSASAVTWWKTSVSPRCPAPASFPTLPLGSKWVRFCFAKKPETIAAAAERLTRIVR